MSAKNKINIAIPIITLLLGAYLSPIQKYFEKEFEDIATKKNVTEITEKIESVKVQYLEKIELLKSDLSKESDFLIRKRKVYADIAQASRIFIQGNYATFDRQLQFINNYSELWLWAPDSVINKLNYYLELNQWESAGKGSISQRTKKKAFFDFILAMRKDAGWDSTALELKDYQFVKFP